MSFSIGIVGLPNAGKSTLFTALTKKQVDIAEYPFTTIDPNVGQVPVPDRRLEQIAEITKPEKITPTIISFVDIAGLVKGAHKGEGLGNQFLAHIRECDAILEVIRGFSAESIEHVEGRINPEKDMEIIRLELIMKDLETLEKAIAGFEKGARDKNSLKRLELIKRLKNGLEEGKKIDEINLTEEEISLIKDLQLLTIKPALKLINTPEKEQEGYAEMKNVFLADLKLEKEISEIKESEREELQMESSLDRLIVACYNILGLITFYTVAGEKESRAWTLEKGRDILAAAEKVHSDFKEQFKKAEVIGWQKLIECKSWLGAREKGSIQTVGKDYVVKDGDIIQFKI